MKSGVSRRPPYRRTDFRPIVVTGALQARTSLSRPLFQAQPRRRQPDGKDAEHDVRAAGPDRCGRPRARRVHLVPGLARCPDQPDPGPARRAAGRSRRDGRRAAGHREHRRRRCPCRDGRRPADAVRGTCGRARRLGARRIASRRRAPHVAVRLRWGPAFRPGRCGDRAHRPAAEPRARLPAPAPTAAPATTSPSRPPASHAHSAKGHGKGDAHGRDEGFSSSKSKAHHSESHDLPAPTEPPVPVSGGDSGKVEPAPSTKDKPGDSEHGNGHAYGHYGR